MQTEGIAIEARKLLLQRASQGAVNFAMNKQSQMVVDTDHKEIGKGIYV